MHAKFAAMYINAWCQKKWPEDRVNAMPSTMANGPFIDVFDHVGGGSHKYIPAEKLTADLEMPEGAGVFGYWKMKDGSYLLRTVPGPLAYWSGKEEDKAEWGEFAVNREDP